MIQVLRNTIKPWVYLGFQVPGIEGYLSNEEDNKDPKLRISSIQG